MLDLSEAERSAAAEKVKVSCTYKGTTVQDAPLHSQQAITYEWSVNDSGPFEHKSCVNKTVDIQVCTILSHFLALLSLSCIHILSSHRQMDFTWEGNVSQDELS